MFFATLWVSLCTKLKLQNTIIYPLRRFMDEWWDLGRVYHEHNHSMLESGKGPLDKPLLRIMIENEVVEDLGPLKLKKTAWF